MVRRRARDASRARPGLRASGAESPRPAERAGLGPASRKPVSFASKTPEDRSKLPSGLEGRLLSPGRFLRPHSAPLPPSSSDRAARLTPAPCLRPRSGSALAGEPRNLLAGLGTHSLRTAAPPLDFSSCWAAPLFSFQGYLYLWPTQTQLRTTPLATRPRRRLSRGGGGRLMVGGLFAGLSQTISDDFT